MTSLEQLVLANGSMISRTQKALLAGGIAATLESLGSGIPRILATYSKDAFTFTENFTRLTYLFSKFATSPNTPSIPPSIGGAIENTGGAIDLTKRQKEILTVILADPKISFRKLAESLVINEYTVKEHFESLKSKGAITRIGGTRGHWQVNLKQEGSDA